MKQSSLADPRTFDFCMPKTVIFLKFSPNFLRSLRSRLILSIILIELWLKHAKNDFLQPSTLSLILCCQSISYIWCRQYDATWNVELNKILDRTKWNIYGIVFKGLKSQASFIRCRIKRLLDVLLYNTGIYLDEYTALWLHQDLWGTMLLKTAILK